MHLRFRLLAQRWADMQRLRRHLQVQHRVGHGAAEFVALGGVVQIGFIGRLRHTVQATAQGQQRGHFFRGPQAVPGAGQQIHGLKKAHAPLARVGPFVGGLQIGRAHV